MRSFLLSMLIVLVAGCSTNTSGISANSEARDNNQWLIVDNFGLGRRLTILDARTVEEGDRLRGFATVKSTASSTQKLQYRFYWFDEQGVQLDLANTPWHPLALHGHQEIQVQSVALDTRADSFKVYIREVKN